MTNNDGTLNPQDTVSSFLLPSGVWNPKGWDQLLPQWVIDIIHTVRPPRSQENDDWCWRPSSDGKFSIKSAYDFIERQNRRKPEKIWQKIWKWPIPEKIKFFLWQASLERIPHNHLRAKRGLTQSAECPFECNSEEDTLHILRDCHIAREAWSFIVDTNALQNFFSGNLQVWLTRNSKHHMGKSFTRRWPWTKIFGHMCWLLWTTRCKGVLEGVMAKPVEIKNLCLIRTQEDADHSSMVHRVLQTWEKHHPRWVPPQPDQFRLDVDGSVDAQQHAACGGVIRDSEGNWIIGFQQTLGFMPITAAEIMAIKVGLQTCKGLGLNNLLVYTDSLEALNLILRDYGTHHPWKEDIHEVRSLLYDSWDLKLSYCDRMAVRCADFLAKTAHTMQGLPRLLYSPPAGCTGLLYADSLGLS